MNRAGEKKFFSPVDLEEELSALECATDWHQCRTDALTFCDTGDSIAVTIPDGTVADLVKSENRALESLFERLQIEGVGLKRLPYAELSQILNTVVKYATQQTNIAVRDGKVIVCLSKGETENDYVSLNTGEILDKTRMSLYSLCGDEEEEFVGRIEDGKYVCANFLLPIKREVNGKMYKIEVQMSTSDFGHSGVHFLASLRKDGTDLPLFERSVLHRNKNAMKDIDDTISMLEKSIDDGKVELELMQSIRINHPSNCMRRIGKKMKLPKKSFVPVIDKKERSGDAPCTAFELYEMLCEGLKDYQSKANAQYVRHYQSLIKSLIGINWENYDLPGSFSW
jgi:hypothetical protein